jgi:pantoate kinase
MSLSRWAAAVAPGHVTGVFVPSVQARDPRARGSVGGGLVLDRGAFAAACWAPGETRRISVRDASGSDLPISREVAERLLGRQRGRLTVTVFHGLPVGQGFGMSAAGALATALCVGDLLGVPARRSVEVAHLADLFGGGGLGGVAAILGGGVEFRVRPGIPPWGRINHRPWAGPVWVGEVGSPIPSPRALASPTLRSQIDAAAAEVQGLLTHQDSSALFAASARFTDRLGLAGPALRRQIQALRSTGAWTMQTMFGRCWLAVPPTGRVDRDIEKLLAERGWPAERLHGARRGAHLVAQGSFGSSLPLGAVVPRFRSAPKLKYSIL